LSKDSRGIGVAEGQRDWVRYRGVPPPLHTGNEVVFLKTIDIIASREGCVSPPRGRKFDEQLSN